jgi:hypothetical protein
MLDGSCCLQITEFRSANGILLAVPDTKWNIRNYVVTFFLFACCCAVGNRIVVAPFYRQGIPTHVFPNIFNN